jgi:Holliday junction DNA helicase RuvB
MTRKESSLEAHPHVDLDPRESVSEQDGALDASLRPTQLSEFVGQREVIDHLTIVLSAAKARSQCVDHLLFVGPPGLGKTSLASIVAKEMDAGIRITSGPVLTRPGDVAAILTDVAANDVIFIDELHRLPRTVEEVLYSAMEDRCIDVLVGKGPSARSLRLELPPFTLIGATTKTGLLSAPLRDRFGFIGQLDLYEASELALIVERSAALLEMRLDGAAARQIAGRSRGTPRIANRLLRRVRDFATFEQLEVVSEAVAQAAMERFGVDELGLDKTDRRLLTFLAGQEEGRAVGLSTLAHSLSEDPDTIEYAIEPFLLREGLLQRTPKGRVATYKAQLHLGISVN